MARRVGVGIAAWAFVAATLFEIATQRDDWPLSAFNMYTTLQGPVASRSFVRGVSDHGEFELAEEMLPVGGVRLRHLLNKLAKSPKRRRQMIGSVLRRYEERREHHGWPELQAIRVYRETWKIRPGLEGIDRPKRRLSDSIYLPPSALVERLAHERKSEATPGAARRAASGDLVLDLEASACQPGCEAFDDRYAAAGRALRLSSGDDERGSVSVPVTLTAGTWSLLARMRTPASRGGDQLRVALDGQRVGGEDGLGNYVADLGDGAWVWASERPGRRALLFEVKRAGRYELRLEVSKRNVELDELWLARGQRELPSWNEPLSP